MIKKIFEKENNESKNKEKIIENLDKIESTVLRATSIVKSLRKLAKQDSLDQAEEFTVNELIKDIVNISK